MTLTPLATWTPSALAPTDSVEVALGRVLDDPAGLLPVVDAAQRLLGVVTEEDLLGADGPDALVTSVLRPMPVTIGPEAHVFEATKLLVRHGLEAVAVVDDDHYLGFARRHDIFERFAQMLATNDPGAVVSVEVAPRDLALSQLVYAAEQNGVRVRAVVMEPHIVHESDAALDADDPDGLRGVPRSPDVPSIVDEALVRVTLKLDTVDAARVRAMFEHYGYRVVATHGEREDDADLNDRVDAFMRYLDM